MSLQKSSYAVLFKKIRLLNKSSVFFVQPSCPWWLIFFTTENTEVNHKGHKGGRYKIPPQHSFIILFKKIQALPINPLCSLCLPLCPLWLLSYRLQKCFFSFFSSSNHLCRGRHIAVVQQI